MFCFFSLVLQFYSSFLFLLAGANVGECLLDDILKKYCVVDERVGC